MYKTAALLALAALVGGALWLFLRTPAPEPEPVAEISAPETTSSLNTDSRKMEPVPLPAPAVPAPTAPALRQAFESKLEKAQSALPTRDQFRKLKPHELHSTPAALLDAGTEIGEIDEAIEKDPSLAPQGIEFYAKCLRREELNSSVRVLCLKRLRDLSRKTGAELNESEFPEDLRRRANKLAE